MGDNSNEKKRPLFGARYLEDPSDTFQHNVWDNIQWDSEQEEEAKKKVEMQAKHKIPETEKEQLLKETEYQWDKFYDIHQNRFFKDRHWLFTEFPELAGKNQKDETPLRVFPDNVKSETNKSESAKCDSKEQSSTPEDVEKQGQTNILEIGCGVGNTVLPIMEYNIDPNLFVYCCDFSKSAISILKSHEDYNPKRCHAFECDITDDDWKAPFPASSIDITTLIFVLSAIHPQMMSKVVSQVYNYLKPGGQVFFRDYGRYDMAQLRFKDGQMLDDNFYMRKDGTFVYFFTQEEVRNLFCGAGFEEELNYVDRRLQVNRSRQLKMYRVWVQAKYRKPLLMS